MADKKGKNAKNARRWTENMLELFARVLANLENTFASSLEELALKRSANNEAFEHIKNTFEMEIDNEIKRQCYKIRIYKLHQKFRCFSFFQSKISEIESNYS